MVDHNDREGHRGLPIGVLTLDPMQGVRACDEMFCRIFGCEAGDIVGRSLDELFSPRDRRASLELATKLSRFSGGVLDMLVTFRIRGSDHLARLRLTDLSSGYTAFVEPVLGDQNLIYRFTLVEQRWKGVFRSSNDGIVVLDQEGRVVEHNASFFSLMRFRDAHGVSLSEDAVAGRPILELVRSAFPGFAEYLREPEGDFEARSVDIFDCLALKATPIALPSGQRIGTFVLVRDIAEELQIAARDAVIRENLLHARTFQQAILPTPPVVRGHDLQVAYRPRDEVGGDIYDIMLLGDIIRIFIADATGHGVPAALVTMLIKSAYEFAKHSPRGPAFVLKTLNDRVAAAHGNLDVMCTAAIVDVDLKSRTLQYSCGAHPPPLLVRNRGRVEELESGGTFVGVEPGKSFPTWKRELDRTDGLYLFTDGISESRRANGEFFGDARLKSVIAEANELPSGSPIGDAILARVDAWLRPGKPDDDVTIIAVRPTENADQ